MPHPEEHKFTTAEIDTNDSELDCYVAGFGTIWAGGPPSGSLLAVSVPQVKNEQCNDWFYESTGGQASGWITNTMICAGYEEGRLDACQDDSGGPLSCVKRSVSADEHESSVWYSAFKNVCPGWKYGDFWGFWSEIFGKKIEKAVLKNRFFGQKFHSKTLKNGRIEVVGPTFLNAL